MKKKMRLTYRLLYELPEKGKSKNPGTFAV